MKKVKGRKLQIFLIVISAILLFSAMIMKVVMCVKDSFDVVWVNLSDIFLYFSVILAFIPSHIGKKGENDKENEEKENK